MITQRQIDEWRIEAEEKVLAIREEFLQTLTKGREAPAQPPPQAGQLPPQAGQLPPQAGQLPPE